MPLCRTTIHPIINRLGVETLIGRMTRLREDERFRAIVPDSVVLPYPQAPSHLHAGLQKSEPVENEGEIWFDWGFVDFWKSNYCMVSSRFRFGSRRLHYIRGRCCTARARHGSSSNVGF